MKLYAYSREGCKKILLKHKLSCTPFWKWMYGQTCPVLPSGRVGVWPYDLHRYIEWKKGGRVPVWD